MNPVRWSMALVLPVAWGLLCYAGYHYPGDEYGMWAFSSIAGLWGLMIVDTNIAEHGPWVVLITGVITMAIAGALLTLLRGPWLLLGSIWFVAAGVLLALSLGQFESMQRAISKNGSLQAYLLASTLAGMTIATGVTLVVMAVWRAAGRWRRRGSAEAAMAA